MRFLIITLISLLFSATPISASAENEDGKKIFNEIYQLCSDAGDKSVLYKSFLMNKKMWRYRNQMIWESTTQTFAIEGLDPEIITDAIVNKTLFSDKLDTLLHSEESKKALDACFGKNDFLRLSFISSMIQSDLEGKKMGTIATAGVYLSGVKLLLVVGKYSRPLKYALIAGSLIYPAYQLYRILNPRSQTDFDEDEKEARAEFMEFSGKLMDSGVSAIDNLLVRAEIKMKELENTIKDPQKSDLEKSMAREKLAKIKENYNALKSRRLSYHP